MKNKSEFMAINYLLDQFDVMIKNDMPCLIPIVIETPRRRASFEEQLTQKKELNVDF